MQQSDPLDPRATDAISGIQPSPPRPELARAAEQAPQRSRVCAACRTELDPQATKCFKCGSDQSWGARLHLATTTMSLLVALISVTGVVLPVMRDTLFDGPRIRVKLDRVEQSTPNGSDSEEDGPWTGNLPSVELTGGLIVANAGNQSAYMRSARVELRVAGHDRVRIDRGHTGLPATKTVDVEIDQGRQSQPGRIEFVPFHVIARIDAEVTFSQAEQRAHMRFPLSFAGSRLLITFVRPDLSEEEFSVPITTRSATLGAGLDDDSGDDTGPKSKWSWGTE